MCKYLVVHPVGKKWKPKKNRSIVKAVKANVTRDAYWIKSWFVPSLDPQDSSAS